MQFSNKFNVPLPVALWLTIDEYEPSKYDLEISATGLLKSPRYIMAQLRTKYPERFPEHLRPVKVEPTEVILPDIQDRIAARIGTAIHSSIEKAWSDYYKEGLLSLGYPEDKINDIVINPTEPVNNKIPVHQEKRLYKQVQIDNMTFVVSGQFDMVVNGNLHDIKSTSTYSFENGCNDLKYIKQGSIYRWLDPDMITGSKLTINFIFLDWKKYMDNKNSNYPPAKAYFKQYDLMSLSEIEMFIRNKLKQLVHYWDYPLELIPCCTIEDLFTDKPKFKYYKNGLSNSTRSTKNFDTFAEASSYRAKQGFKGEIVEDRGKPFMCPYCNPDEVTKLSQQHKQFSLEID